jgi:hypothetical protein
MEAMMRVIIVVISAIVIVAVSGLSLHLTPSAIATLPEQAIVRMDPNALHLSIDVKSLPKQDVEAIQGF